MVSGWGLWPLSTGFSISTGIVYLSSSMVIASCENAVFEVVFAQLLHDTFGEDFPGVVEAGDARLEVLEALEGATLAFVEDVVAEFLPNTGQEV